MKPKPPNGGKPVPAAQLDLAALPTDYPKSVWIEGDGTVLGLTGQEGGCSKVRADLTEQTDTVVRVHLVETSPVETRPCTMDLRYPPLTVHLAAPLGARTVAVTVSAEKK
ncbi:hypothetical protein F0L68_29500 [Solihabitans fulvus]|uniref:Uncharacterized protein n=1 Tax=Solihabitans fulvus TaxID=1892852 RepID=A0A5B2WVT8_9PSEU|nr:hypothetical protein F0L68_29500 [Solihabitans fulvus]